MMPASSASLGSHDGSREDDEYGVDVDSLWRSMHDEQQQQQQHIHSIPPCRPPHPPPYEQQQLLYQSLHDGLLPSADSGEPDASAAPRLLLLAESPPPSHTPFSASFLSSTSLSSASLSSSLSSLRSPSPSALCFDGATSSGRLHVELHLARQAPITHQCHYSEPMAEYADSYQPCPESLYPLAVPLGPPPPLVPASTQPAAHSAQLWTAARRQPDAQQPAHSQSHLQTAAAGPRLQQHYQQPHQANARNATVPAEGGHYAQRQCDADLCRSVEWADVRSMSGLSRSQPPSAESSHRSPLSARRLPLQQQREEDSGQYHTPPLAGRALSQPTFQSQHDYQLPIFRSTSAAVAATTPGPTLVPAALSASHSVVDRGSLIAAALRARRAGPAVQPPAAALQTGPFNGRSVSSQPASLSAAAAAASLSPHYRPLSATSALAAVVLASSPAAHSSRPTAPSPSAGPSALSWEAEELSGLHSAAGRKRRRHMSDKAAAVGGSRTGSSTDCHREVADRRFLFPPSVASLLAESSSSPVSSQRSGSDVVDRAASVALSAAHQRRASLSVAAHSTAIARRLSLPTATAVSLLHAAVAATVID